jgi:hypothetical protein
MKNTHAHRWLVALAVAAGALSADLALAGDAAQFSTDCSQILVNKQVGDNEQWAITYDIATQEVNGNVFKLDGSDPSFIDCDFVSEDEGQITFDCFGSDGCVFEEFCGGDQWTLIGEGIVVPLSFFLPEGLTGFDSPDEVCLEVGF